MSRPGMIVGHQDSRRAGCTLDVQVDDDRKDAEVQRLTAHGARLTETHSDRGPLTYVMRDPEGNEFCLH